MGPFLFGTPCGQMKGHLDRKSTNRRLFLEPLEPRQMLATGLLGPPVVEPAAIVSEEVGAQFIAEPPKNVIVMIGDGMGPEHVNAGRMFLGGEIIFDQFPYQAEVTTFSASSSVTDSAAAATAMATGQKVNNGVISKALPGDGSPLTTSLEILRDAGKVTGLVTTTAITHATPAAFGAHATSRTDTAQIAADLLQHTRPNVLLGGSGGLTSEAAQNAGYTVVTDRDGLAALDTDAETFVSGQFGSNHLPYEYDGLGNLPHLSEMTTSALDLLDNDPDGFFLMVEGGRIDHAGHANDIQRNVRETAEFANTVEVVLDWAAGRTDTLVVVTADHETGGLTVISDVVNGSNAGLGVAPDVTWSTSGHTGVNVPIYAWGANAEYVTGVLDNTDVFRLATDGAAQPLGVVDDLSLTGLDPSAGDLWYRARTTRAGLFTIEATSAAGTEGVELALYDRGLNLLATSAPVSAAGFSGRSRIDWQADAVATYLIALSGSGADVTSSNNVGLHLVNLVDISPDGTQVTVYGTDSDDQFTATARSAMTPSAMSAVINGVTYKFESATSLDFSGGAGVDSATVIGSAGIETARLYPNSGTVTGPGYEIRLAEVATIALQGEGGDDTVWLFGSPGKDKFVGAPRFGKLRGSGYSNIARSFPNVRADVSGEGVDSVTGSDTAKLYDSPGDDSMIASPQSVRLSGDGFSVEIEHFDGVHAYATAGGVDRAEFYDSAGDDLYVAGPTHAALFSATPGNSEFYNRAKYFEQTQAEASAGGVDVVKFYDSSGNDSFYAKGSYAALYNQTYQEPYTNGFYHRARFFDGVHAYATAGGIDEARLYDSPRDDVFYADPQQGALFRAGEYYNRAKFFEGVHAYATAGGHDEARLFDSPGDDFFYANPNEAALYKPGEYYNRAKFFEQVRAAGTAGGHDEARLLDSESVDLLTANGNRAQLSNAALDFLYEVSDFEYVRATASTVGDTLISKDPAFDLDAIGIWSQP